MANNEDNGSIFKSLAIGTPLVIGGAVSLSRIKKDSNFFGAAIRDIPQTTPEIRRLVNESEINESVGLYRNYQAERLQKLTENTTLTSTQLKNVWRRATKSIDPTGEVSRILNNKVVGSSSKEIMQDIRSLVKETSGSHYLRRATDIFLHDVETLSDVAGQGININTHRVPISLMKTSPNVGENIMSEVEKLANKLGAGFKVSRSARKGHIGSELSVVLSSKRLGGNVTLKIPGISNQMPGIVARGANQQSRYIAGTYGIVEKGMLKEIFNHEEWMLGRAQEELVPELLTQKKLTNRMAHSIIHNFESKMAENLEWVQSISPGSHKGWEEWTRIRSQIMRLKTPEGKNIDPLAYAEIIEQGGLKNTSGQFIPVLPGYSPNQIVAGVVSTHNYKGTASLIDWSEQISRRPMQWLRSDYAPTEEALWQMKHMDELSDRFSWAAAKGGVPSPIAKTAYVSAQHTQALQSAGVTTEGMGLLSTRLRDAREVEKITTYDVSSGAVSEDVKKLLGKGAFSQKTFSNTTLSKGTFLGLDPEGRPLTLGSNSSLIEANAFLDIKKKNFLRIITKEDVPFSPYEKTYLGGKMMAANVKPGYIKDIMEKTLGAGHIDNVDAIVAMDELRKNKRLFYNQMFSSLWNYTKMRVDSGKTTSSLAFNFANDPLKVIQSIAKNNIINDIRNEEGVLREAWEIARRGRLSPEEIGSVFGAVPEVFGAEHPLRPFLSSAENIAVNKGVAEGFTQFFYGGPGGSGAGNRATIEPRLWELLTSSHFGPLGKELQADIAYRMVSSNPELIEDQKIINSSLQSLVAGKKIASAQSPSALIAGIPKEQLLPTKSSVLSVPGFGDIKIPGEEVSSRFATRILPSGYAMASPLGLTYRNFIEQAALYEADKIDKPVMGRAVDTLASELAVHQTAMVTGKGGLLGNRLPGSRVFTAVTATSGIKLADHNTIGITADYAQKMFDDLKQLYDHDNIKEMEERFMKGKTISAITARHPFIGPYSAMPVKAQLIPGEGAYAVVNEIMKKAYTTEAGKITDLGYLRFSPLVGMAGDTDGDTISMTLAGPQLEKSLTAHMNKQSTLDLYEQYSIRSQLLKAKATQGNIPMSVEMAGDVLKLGVPQSQIGKMSYSFSIAKAAVLRNSANKEAMFNSLSLLEWLEQTPISGKHLASEKSVEMIDMFDQIQEAMQKKNSNVLADTARQVLSQAKASGRRALDEGLNVSIEDIAGGALRNVHIPGIKIDDTSKHRKDSINAAQVSSDGQNSAAQLRQFAMGKYKPQGLEEAANLLSPETLKHTPFGDLFHSSIGPTGIKGLGAKISTKAVSIINKAGAAGARLLEHARPLALGGAAALGLAMLLSKPTQSISPQQVAPSKPNLQSGSGGGNIDPDVIMPSQGIGSPTARNMVGSGNTARISGKRISVRGTSTGNLDYQEFNQNLSSSLGSRANVHTTINDRRSSLTSQKISDILE